MLAFIVSRWDFASRDLHKMGLFMGDEMSNLVDDIHLGCKLFNGYNKSFETMQKWVMAFFHLAITDSEPSSRSNPIIWWMAVLVRIHVLDGLPELPLGRPDNDFDPVLTFHGKLQALDHYARVLVLDRFIYSCKPSDYKEGYLFKRASSAILEKVVVDLDSQNRSWVDKDQEPPSIRIPNEDAMIATPAWQECLSRLRNIAETWLSIDSQGPMHEVLSLVNGVVPNRSYTQRGESDLRHLQLSLEHTTYEYKVVYQLWEDYTEGLGGYNMGSGGPLTAGALSWGTYDSAQEANREARAALLNEFGRKSDAMFWNKHLREDGTVKIRAVFVDSADNTKVIAWVEKQPTAAGS